METENTEIDNDDVTIIVEEPVRCKRSLLIQHSEYFKAMFAGNFRESNNREIEIQNVSCLDFRTILSAVFNPDVLIEEDRILGALRTSNMLQFLKVEQKCINQILTSLSTSNCLKYWFETEEILFTDISAKAKLLSLLELDKVSKTDGFYELNLTKLKRYLGSLYLRSKEMDVFDSILKWFKHSTSKNNNDLMELILCIDFTSIDSTQLSEMIKKCKPPIYKNLHDLLIVYKELKNGSDVSNQLPKYCETADLLTQSKNRNLHGFPHFLAFIDKIPQICELGKCVYYEYTI